MHKHLLILFLLFFFNNSYAITENPDQQSQEIVEHYAKQIEKEFFTARQSKELTDSEKENTLRSYNHLDPKRWIPTHLLKKAVLYFDKNKSRFKNQNYITIADMSPRSNNYRLYLLDMRTGKVDRYRTSHGEGSDVNNDGYAESFGNVPGSKKSSLGYVRTAEVYYGSFGRSLRLDGLSSTNSKIRQRAVVFHGWSQTIEAPKIQTRSWGCITMDLTLRDYVLDKIANGSFMLVDTSL